MTDPTTITTKHDTPLFDPEDHRVLAAQQMCFEPTEIHCIACGPDGFETTAEAVYSEDGTLLKPRVVSYERSTTWAPKPAVAARAPTPEAPPVHSPVVHHVPTLPRGACWHGVIDGNEGQFISDGDKLVLVSSAEGQLVIKTIEVEALSHQTATGG